MGTDLNNTCLFRLSKNSKTSQILINHTKDAKMNFLKDKIKLNLIMVKDMQFYYRSIL